MFSCVWFNCVLICVYFVFICGFILVRNWWFLGVSEIICWCWFIDDFVCMIILDCFIVVSMCVRFGLRIRYVLVSWLGFMLLVLLSVCSMCYCCLVMLCLCRIGWKCVMKVLWVWSRRCGRLWCLKVEVMWGVFYVWCKVVMMGVWFEGCFYVCGMWLIWYDLYSLVSLGDSMMWLICRLVLCLKLNMW